MSRAVVFTSAATLGVRQARPTSAPLPTTTLLLTIGSLPLPLRTHVTG
ncbi:MAG: hypothetical protein JSU08_20105 [Acidobacteria bacterium]|nr:hypothetical protein [Acidobacteriota bacterium]